MRAKLLDCLRHSAGFWRWTRTTGEGAQRARRPRRGRGAVRRGGAKLASGVFQGGRNESDEVRLTQAPRAGWCVSDSCTVMQQGAPGGVPGRARGTRADREDFAAGSRRLPRACRRSPGSRRARRAAVRGGPSAGAREGGSPVTAFRRSPVGPKAAPRGIVRGVRQAAGMARAGLQDQVPRSVRDLDADGAGHNPRRRRGDPARRHDPFRPAPAGSCAKIIPAGPAQALRAAILRRQSGSTALRYRLFDILLEYPAGSRVRDRIWAGSRPARVRHRCPQQGDES